MLVTNIKTTERRQRILALDLIRGILLLVLIVNHLAWGPSLFSLIGGEGQLFASAAEGFFVISGVLVGYIYGGKILTSTKSVFKKIWKRALILYVLAVTFTLFYTAWAVLYPDSLKYQTLYPRDGISFLYNTFSLRYAFGWADFLTRYSVFMAVAPFVIWLIAKGKAWLVALLSVAVWALFRETLLLLPFSAWQLVFIFGMIIGYYLPTIEKWATSLPKKAETLLYKLTVGITASTLVLSIIMLVIIPYFVDLHPSLVGDNLTSYVSAVRTNVLPFFDKNTLDPARIAVGIVWFCGIYVFVRKHEKNVDKHTRGILLTTGQNSLYVYGVHAFVLFFIDMYLLPPEGGAGVLLNTLVTIAVLGLIYAATKYKQIFSELQFRILPSTRPNDLI